MLKEFFRKVTIWRQIRNFFKFPLPNPSGMFKKRHFAMLPRTSALGVTLWGKIALYAACMLLQASSKFEDRNALGLVLLSGPDSARGVEILAAVLRAEPLSAAAVVSRLEFGPAPRAQLAHRAFLRCFRFSRACSAPRSKGRAVRA